jgi:hypothetical protein
MKAYILTRAAPRLRAHHLAARLGLDPTFVCDTGAQADLLVGNFGIPSSRIVVNHGSPGPPCGAAYQRHYVGTQLAPRGEWWVWLDDNVSHLSGLPPRYSRDELDLRRDPPAGTWRGLFAHRLAPDEVWKHLHQTIEAAERRNTIFAGFSTESNFFFRRRKWQLFGYVRTQFALYKNDGSGWYPTPDMMFEDMYKTVDVAARYGCVVVNRHMKPYKPAFESGGIGSLDQRRPWLAKNCAWLMSQYPGLLRYSKGRDYHVTFRVHSEAGMRRWLSGARSAQGRTVP